MINDRHSEDLAAQALQLSGSVQARLAPFRAKFRAAREGGLRPGDRLQDLAFAGACLAAFAATFWLLRWMLQRAVAASPYLAQLSGEEFVVAAVGAPFLVVGLFQLFGKLWPQYRSRSETIHTAYRALADQIEFIEKQRQGGVLMGLLCAMPVEDQAKCIGPVQSFLANHADRADFTESYCTAADVIHDLLTRRHGGSPAAAA